VRAETPMQMDALPISIDKKKISCLPISVNILLLLLLLLLILLLNILYRILTVIYLQQRIFLGYKILKLNVGLLLLKLHSTRRGLVLLAHWTWH